MLSSWYYLLIYITWDTYKWMKLNLKGNIMLKIKKLRKSVKRYKFIFSMMLLFPFNSWFIFSDLLCNRQEDMDLILATLESRFIHYGFWSMWLFGTISVWMAISEIMLKLLTVPPTFCRCGIKLAQKIWKQFETRCRWITVWIMFFLVCTTVVNSLQLSNTRALHS